MLANQGPDPSFANVNFLINVKKEFHLCFDVQKRSYEGYIIGKKGVSQEPLIIHAYISQIFLIISFSVSMSPPSQVWFDSWVQLRDPVASI